MNVKALAPRKKCLSELVRRMTLDSVHETEQKFLAWIYAAIVDGGKVTFEINGKRHQITCEGIKTRWMAAVDNATEEEKTEIKTDGHS